MSLSKQKHRYLTENFGFKFKKGINNFKAKCELCKTTLPGNLVISKYGNPYSVNTAGQFHHDSKGEIHLLCGTCHLRLHDWGLIQRWLDKIEKKVEDLPDCRGLKPWRRGW